jgi:catechol 2,3-dioxygenase-like lactoylglutathione lyase family enzyme
MAVDVSLEEAQAILAALVVMAGERKGNAAFALADLLSRRGWSVPARHLLRGRERSRNGIILVFRDAFTILDTADVARLSAFYIDRLGFQPGYRWPHEEEPTFRVVSLDAFSIGLSKIESLPASGRTAFWLYADDVDREIERLRAQGVRVVAEPADSEWGERMATISDPDGNLVHIGQRAVEEPN